MRRELLDLPAQPAGLAWPTAAWERGDARADGALLAARSDLLFDPATADRLGETHALLVVQQGRIVHERYADDVEATETLRSWSMAKSMLHAAVGILARDDRLDLDARPAVPEWESPGDPRAAITHHHLLTMRPGLDWVEEYEPGRPSDVIEMLFSNALEGVDDTGGYAADKPLGHEPGSFFNYSSGTSNIVARLVRDVVGSAAECEAWLREQLFDPLGMSTATPKFDRSGTWVASSYCFCTAQDFARFGYLYLRGGTWDGTEIVSRGWVDDARTETGRDDQGRIHTAHWWLFGDNPWGAFHCSGYEGQYIVAVPALDMVVVRLGRTHADLRPHLVGELTTLIAAFEAP